MQLLSMYVYFLAFSNECGKYTIDLSYFLCHFVREISLGSIKTHTHRYSFKAGAGISGVIIPVLDPIPESNFGRF